jgi:hypothetical protein
MYLYNFKGIVSREGYFKDWSILNSSKLCKCYKNRYNFLIVLQTRLFVPRNLALLLDLDLYGYIGSERRIPVRNVTLIFLFSSFFHSRSRIQGQNDSRIRIRIKEFKPKKLFQSSWKYDPKCLSRIRILIFHPSRIPGSKRHRIPDPDPQQCFLCDIEVIPIGRYR